MDKKNNKRVAIVTGSASGIGAATAVELSRRGFSVLVNYSKSKEQAKQVAARCREGGKDAIVWLIEGARQTTGETIFVDGGMHISTPR